jgi:GNAT superfamily N-acetyltransferase
VDAVAATLALAFEDDPVMEFLLPDGASRARRLTRFFQAGLSAQHVAFGACFTDAERAGAAVWDPPGRWHTTTAQLVRGAPAFIAALGLGIPRALRALAAVQRAHPSAPHYYLAVLGTRPDRQGHGLGSALLRPILARCDADGLGAYLESSKERNLPFYRRHGF